MADVTFNINAVDRTRAAFLSARRNLTDLNKSVQKLTSTAGIAGVTVRLLGLASAVTAVTKRAQYLNEHFEQITGIPDSAVTSVDLLASEMRGVTWLIDRVILGYMRGIPSAIQLSIYAFDRLTKGEEAAAQALVERERRALEYARSRPEYVKALTKANEDLARSERELEMVGKGRGYAADVALADAAAHRERALAITDEVERVTELARANRELASAQSTIAGLSKELAAAQREAGVALAPLIGSTLKGKESIDALRQNISRLQYELGNLDTTSAQGMDTAIQKWKEMASSAETLNKLVAETNKHGMELGWAFSSAFEDAILSGEKFGDVLNGLIQDVARLMLRNMVTQPLANYLGGVFGGMFGGGKAAGGPVSSGTSYLVGENGPEIFTPSTAGRILPSHDMGGSAGGDTYIIDARGADASGMRRLESMIAALNGSIERRAVSANREYTRRRAA